MVELSNCTLPSGELRKINCDLGTLSRPDGSAIYAAGETVVIASVNGPCEVNLRKQLIEEAAVEVLYRPKSGIPGVQEKLVETTLTKISEVAILRSQYPRSLITIVVQEMQDCGGLLACAINALCLALINSGLPMQYLFAATCCIINANGDIVIDPDNKKAKDSRAVFTLTMDSSGNIISSDISGVFSEREYKEIVQRCQEATSKIFLFYREIVKKFSDRISL